VVPTLIPQGAIEKLENNVRITTVLENYSLTRTANLPIPVEFKVQGEIQLLLFKYHPYFDGLCLWGRQQICHPYIQIRRTVVLNIPPPCNR